MREPDPVRLLLVRHAQADHDGADPALTPLGREQGAALSRALAAERASSLVSSTMRRAIETASYVQSEFPKDDRLREFNFGPALSQMYQMPEERMDLQLWKAEHGFPGGENLGGFQRRVNGYRDELVIKGVPGSSVVLVTHSGVIEAAIHWAYGLGADAPWVAEIDMAHASITEILCWPHGRRPDGAPRYGVIRRVADVSYLRKDLVSLD